MACVGTFIFRISRAKRRKYSILWHKRLEIISCKRHVLIWASLLATLLFAAQAAVSMPHAPIARAAGSGPIIHWNASMIYAGENNGNPWGPVGENASVQGVNFPANQQFRLVLVQGDSNNDAALCHSPVATVGSATSNSAGQFYQNYSWPAAAGQVNKAYSICAIKAADGSVASSKDDGPFTVLASSPPVINISPASVAAGSTVTVTGHNWVPPQQVNINIAGCADCEPGNTEVTSVTAHSTGLNDGSFSIVVTIPASTKAANYVVNAQTQSGMDANYISGVKHLTITAAAPAATSTTAPTSTPTAAATTTPVSTVTPTAVPGANNTGSNNGSDSSNSGPMLALLVALSLLLLAIAAVVVMDNMGRQQVWLLAIIKPNRPIIHLTTTGNLCNHMDLHPAMVSHILLHSPHSSMGPHKGSRKSSPYGLCNRVGLALRITSIWIQMVTMMPR